MISSILGSNQPGCDRCWVRGRSVFCGLEGDRLASIESRKITRTYRRGEPLYVEGDVSNGVFCIYRGAVKVFRTGRDGREQIVRLASPGDIVGYRSIFDGSAHATCAIALDDVQACFLPRTQFALLCETAPMLAHAMLGLLSHQLVAVEERMLELTQKSVRERLAETLLQLHAIFGVDRDGTTINVRLSRGELAELVGSATESVIRFLTDFKRTGVVTLRGKRIGILNAVALREAANLNTPAPDEAGVDGEREELDDSLRAEAA